MINKRNLQINTCCPNDTNSTTTYDYDVILSTIPIVEIGRLSSLATDVQLEYSKVLLVGIGLHRPQTEWTNVVSWIYYPHDTVFYRCTFISNFNKYMTPDAERYWSVLCEIGLKRDQGYNDDDIIERTIDGNTIDDYLIKYLYRSD